MQFQRPASPLHILRIDVLLVIAFSALLLIFTIFNSRTTVRHLSASHTSDKSDNPATLPAVALRDPFQNFSSDARSLLEKQSRVDYSVIWMSELEVNLVLRYMRKVNTYLEWGSGGSTYNFPQFAKRAHSIEHDQKWCLRMTKEISLRPELSHLKYHCVPIPRGTKGWGIKSAFKEGSYEAFKPYIDQIENLGEPSFDMVLIDGRARVDAAIKALSFLKRKSVVVMHDAERIWTYRIYANVTKYYDIIDSVGGHGRQGLAIMKRKRNYSSLQGNHSAVQEILDNKYPSMKEIVASAAT
ncbi:unnamed protein product [Agarophyton chilense]